MDRETAKKIIEALAWMEFPLNKISAEAWGDPPDIDPNSKLYGYIGDLFSANFALLMHVINQYPEFDPDNDGEELYNQFKLKYQTDEYPFVKATTEELKAAEQAAKKAAEERKNNSGE